VSPWTPLIIPAGTVVIGALAPTLWRGLKVVMGAQSPVVLRTIIVLLVAATLAGSSLTRHDLFLAMSDLKAPLQKALIFRRGTPWWKVAVVFMVILSGGTAIFMVLTTNLSCAMFAIVLVNLPLILLAAAFNSLFHHQRGSSLRAGRDHLLPPLDCDRVRNRGP
jgi:hypothetical protein